MSGGYLERPLFFDADGETLFGVMTTPTSGEPGEHLLAVCPGSWIPSWHRGRMWVRLARTLAGYGVQTLRFDYRGVGASSGRAEFALERPFVSDAAAALEVLRENGSAAPTYLVGTCFGARTAAALAATSARPDGLLFLAVPVRNAKSNRELLRQAASPKVVRNLMRRRHREQYAKIIRRRLKRIRSLIRRRLSAQESRDHDFVEDLAAIVKRRIPCLMVYGSEDREYQWFREAAGSGRLGEVLESAGALIQVRVVPGRFHGFATDASQQIAIEVVREWIQSRRSGQ